MQTVMRISAGAIVWAVHFAALYGATALSCARGDARAVPWIVGLSTLVGVAVVCAIIVRSYPRRDDFAHWLTAAVAAIAGFAMAWEALAGFVARSCG